MASRRGVGPLDPRFEELVASLHGSFVALVRSDPSRIADLGADARVPGVYMLTERGRNLYVGRSNHIRKRLAGHSRPSSPPGSAAFAFRLAREETGHVEARYQRGSGTRAELMKAPTFRKASERGKARIREMDVRVVCEGHPVRQALLEIYVATVLRTP